MMDYGGSFSLDDEHLVERFRSLVAELNADLIVETGTNVGLSTLRLARMVPRVISVDLDPECTEIARRRLSEMLVRNVELLTCDAAVALQELRGLGLLTERTLYFLDAHSHPHSRWTLLEEIRAIPPGTGILVIHDCLVPSRPDLASSRFLCEDGEMRTLDYELMEPALRDWSPTHRVEYNDQAGGCRVGVAVVRPR